jgi:hypothetical protein
MQSRSSSSLSMLGGPCAGLTAWISVVGLATSRADSAMAAVIEAVVFGLTRSSRTRSA